MTIEADGKVSDVTVPSSVPASTASSIRAWLMECRFEPARDPAGIAARVTALQPLKVRVDPQDEVESLATCDLDDAGRVPEVEIVEADKAVIQREQFGGCVKRAIRMPRSMAVVSLDFVMQFLILADGTPAAFRTITPGVRPDVQCVVWQSLRTCAFTPARNSDGRAVAVWMTLPIRIR